MYCIAFGLVKLKCPEVLMLFCYEFEDCRSPKKFHEKESHFETMIGIP